MAIILIIALIISVSLTLFDLFAFPRRGWEDILLSAICLILLTHQVSTQTNSTTPTYTGGTGLEPVATRTIKEGTNMILIKQKVKQYLLQHHASRAAVRGVTSNMTKPEHNIYDWTF